MLLLLVTGCSVRELARQAIFPGQPQRLPPGDRIEGSRPPTLLVDYAADDGTRLRGALVSSGTTGVHDVIVYFHGNRESAATGLYFAQTLGALASADVFLA